MKKNIYFPKSNIENSIYDGAIHNIDVDKMFWININNRNYLIIYYLCDNIRHLGAIIQNGIEYFNTIVYDESLLAFYVKQNFNNGSVIQEKNSSILDQIAWDNNDVFKPYTDKDYFHELVLVKYNNNIPLDYPIVFEFKGYDANYNFIYEKYPLDEELQKTLYKYANRSDYTINSFYKDKNIGKSFSAKDKEIVDVEKNYIPGMHTYRILNYNVEDPNNWVKISASDTIVVNSRGNNLEYRYSELDKAFNGDGENALFLNGDNNKVHLRKKVTRSDIEDFK